MKEFQERNERKKDFQENKVQKIEDFQENRCSSK